MVLAVVLFGVGYGLLYYFANIWEPKEREEFTYEQITQGLSEKVDHVEYEESKLIEEEKERYCTALSKHNYFKIKDTGSGELQVKVLFYDESDNLLYYVKMYRYGFIFIKGDDFKGTYYMSTTN